MNNNNQGLQNLKTMYEKLTYFDQYGGSVILFFIITIIFIIIVTYCVVMTNAQPIIDDWPNQRCKPNIIPIAGFITHPEGISAIDYTQQNFTYCTQNILSNIAGTSLEPLAFITNSLNSLTNQLQGSIQNSRAMFDKVRTTFQETSQEIMGRIMNFAIPLQQIIINFKDLIAKIQGTLTAGLFTLLGSYYTLKSLMGAIAQFIVTILISLTILIAIFWIVPFTWGAAMANTVIFIAFAIPMAIILVFMSDVLHIHTNLAVPSIKCFDKDTLITMNDGSKKPIIYIKNGDILSGNNEVTACVKVTTEGSQMYKLGNILVSDSHIVNYNDTWISVSNHPHSIKYEQYDRPYLYCLNTTNKIISIDKYTFTDWDEIYGDEIRELISTNPNIQNTQDIHTYLDTGFSSSTQIALQNGVCKEIQNIQVGDVLQNGEKVYGLVKINGKNVNKQFNFNLGNTFVEGGPNLTIFDKTTLPINKIELKHKYSDLYHLLTDTKTFYINQIKFYDYNTAIDLFLTKNNKNYYL